MNAPRILVLAVVALAATACGGGSEPEPTPTAMATATPEREGPLGALAEYVASTFGVEFLEDCAEAVVREDTGKICASFRGERNGQQAYALGPTFSEFDQWAIVEQRAGEWTIIYTPGITLASAAVPGIPWPLQSDVDVAVAGSEQCLNVREGPGLDQAAVDCLDDGTVVQLSSGPIQADDFEWWQLKERAGWVAATYLRYVDTVDAPEEPDGDATPEAEE